MKFKPIVFTAVLAILSSVASLARPDVYFADSNKYQDAYLVHKLIGKNIKFMMSNNTVNLAIPAQQYNFDFLLYFTNNEYIFNEPSLRPEFIDMFDQSFKSTFQTLDFLNELVSLLNAFSKKYPQHTKVD